MRGDKYGVLVIDRKTMLQVGWVAPDGKSLAQAVPGDRAGVWSMPHAYRMARKIRDAHPNLTTRLMQDAQPRRDDRLTH